MRTKTADVGIGKHLMILPPLAGRMTPTVVYIRYKKKAATGTLFMKLQRTKF
jgi:hypothetical protein